MRDQTYAAQINFTRGVPAAEALPTELIKECAVSILSTHASIVLQYHAAAGFEPLRELLATNYGVDPGEILVSNGSLQILDLLSGFLLEPGDTVYLEKPSYDRTITLLRAHRARVFGVPMKKDGLDIEFLIQLLKREVPKFLYIIPDFQNPTGVSTSMDKRRELLELASRYDFWVIEDTPYRSLRYKGNHLPSLHSMNPKRVLHVSSFSKVVSPGLRVGYLIASQKIVRGVAKIAEDTYVTPNMLSQGIVYEFLCRGWLTSNIERLKRLYRPRMEALLFSLAQHLPYADWVEPEGGFFVGVNLPSTVDTTDLGLKAAEKGVNLTDGRAFFSNGDGSSFLRLPFCALSQEQIREGIARLGRAVKELEA